MDRERDLADAHRGLRLFETFLDDVDGQLEEARVAYLGRQVSEPPRWVMRRLHRRARKQYDREARRAEVALRGLLPVLSAGQPPRGAGGQQTAPESLREAGGAAGEPPPCGYCIWRCPHAQARSGALGG
ncbi:hypothetical protein [Streptomyces sp. NPDC020951]|uniref:hypothetical protein n=1 Tax=Streptomyces sp. NPDC020951 TaxID=3365104 RepID=UPI0037BCF976